MKYSQAPDKQWMEVINVYPANKEVHGILRDGGTITVSIFEIPPNFRWPVEKEYWTVERDQLGGAQWILGSRIHHLQKDNEVPITDLDPGDLRLDSSVIVNSQGRRMAAYFSALGTGTGTVIAIPRSVHLLQATRGLITQVQQESTGNVVTDGTISVSATGDVTVTFPSSRPLTGYRVTLIG